jgi:hypothetical protein
MDKIKPKFTLENRVILNGKNKNIYEIRWNENLNEYMYLVSSTTKKFGSFVQESKLKLAGI